MAIGPGSGLSRLFSGTVGQVLGRVANAVLGTQKVEARRPVEALLDGVEPSTVHLMRHLDRMFGRSAIIDGFVPPPDAFRSAGFGGQPPGGFTPMGGAPGGEPFGGGTVGRSIHAAIQQNPQFKADLERALGGQIVTPGPSRQIRVFDGEPPPTPGRSLVTMSSGSDPGAMNAAARANHLPAPNPQLGPLLGGLKSMENNIAALAQELGGKGDAPASTAMDFSDPNKTALDFAMKSVDDTAALRDFKIDDESTVLGGDMHISPALQARMLSQKSATAGQGVPAAIAGASQPAGTGMSDTMKQQMLTQMMNNLKKMYELLSNVLKAMNDMQKTAIDNIK